MGEWNAKWIGYAFDPREDLGVFEFRCKAKGHGGTTRIRISADQRYKLFLNGEMIGFGPQRGDLQHWFFETYDLSLQDGVNELTALVWNFGRFAPMAQISARTGFVCEGDGLSTPGGWEVRRRADWDFAMMHNGIGDYYIDVGPGELVKAGVALEDWRQPYVICQAEDRGSNGGGTPWMLIPRTLPPMLYERSEIEPKRRTDWDGPGVLYDFGELLCAYPRIHARGQGGEEIRLTYAEALWAKSGEKENRDDVARKDFHGHQDRFFASGRDDTFEPLWWRTFRYVLVEAPDGIGLEIEAIRTGYPLLEESSFVSDHPIVKPIWDVSVRTARLCAGETYFDCPYYEQLQYVGDTRIQALIGYYLGTDRALQRNAVETLRWSIMENGLTQSRYPSRQTQVIPPFSLWWVMMLFDQWLYDHEEQSTAVIRQAWEVCLEAYEGDFWQFGDWVAEWGWGVPPNGRKSTPHWLLGQVASHVARSLMHEENPIGATPMKIATNTMQMLKRARVDGLVSFKGDPPSEHAEALLRVLQLLLWNEAEPWPTAALSAAKASECTYYFSYYKHLAMSEIDYLQELEPWREMIESGLTTFAENPEPTRSDCHAWSAHPILGFFQIVAGVTSIDRAWSRAEIRPRPGSLTRFDARIAHPDGELRVALENGALEIVSPVPYRLIWEGKRAEFGPGRQRVG